MIREDDDRPSKTPASHAVGEVLDTLSVEDLRARIAVLTAEIARLEGAIASKEASRHAADAFFKMR